MRVLLNFAMTDHGRFEAAVMTRLGPLVRELETRLAADVE
jgi:hypothetical protein